MEVDVKSFLGELEKRKGKLAKWEAEIFTLLQANASYGDVVEFLKLNGVKVYPMEIYRFTHREKRRHLLDRKAADESKGSNKLDVVLAKKLAEAEKKKRMPGPKERQTQEDSGIPKFDWQETRNKEKPKW